MNAPFISVIIPTYNRAQKLDICLKCIFDQTIAKESYEVIVINDGSNDNTSEILKNWQKEELNLRVIEQKNSGQGIARNKAIKKALGMITVLIGDDIYVSQNFLELHATFHNNNPELNKACLGFIDWYDVKPISTFMEWLTNGGPQFAYKKLKDGALASFWFFYTSNISIKTDLLKKEPFDTDFSLYGWEDIELGYRLTKNHKLKLIFQKNILAHHDHAMEEDSLKQRMQGAGKNAVIFQKKHPQLKVVPHGFKLFALRLISLYPNILILKLLKHLSQKTFGKFYWYALSKRYFLKGVGSL